MNLHLVHDEKFINGAVDLFEKYSPNENIFIVNSSTGYFKYIKIRKEIIILNFNEKKSLKEISILIEKYSIKKVFVHYLDYHKSQVVNMLKKEFNLKTFWVFFGADLYTLLHEDFDYPLFDNEIKQKISFYQYLRSKLSFIKRLILTRDSPKQSILKFIREMDYFCFWNIYDYELLKSYYHTNAIHLDFSYFNSSERNVSVIGSKKDLKIVVNHSGSIFANHSTILNKIYSIDTQKKIKEIIAPLSYGDEEVIGITRQLGNELFKEKFIPILNFLELATYFKIFQDVSVAFYGARRQEAAGNVMYLLGRGVKLFLRNDNNMINYLKDKGFIVYSFEDDFKTIDDLNPLDKEQMIINNEVFNKLFSTEQEKLVMENLLSV